MFPIHVYSKQHPVVHVYSPMGVINEQVYGYILGQILVHVTAIHSDTDWNGLLIQQNYMYAVVSILGLAVSIIQ